MRYRVRAVSMNRKTRAGISEQSEIIDTESPNNKSFAGCTGSPIAELLVEAIYETLMNSIDHNIVKVVSIERLDS